MDFQVTSPAAARESMCRTAALLFLGGAVMTVLGIVFPHSPKADIDGFWAIACGSGLVAALLLGFWQRLPQWSYQGFMVLASLLISLSLYFNGERHGGPAVDNEVLYLWIALYSGYFFTRRETLAQLTVVAAAYAAALFAINPGQVGFTRWFITIGMVSVAGALVYVMKSRNDQLVARLFDAVRTDLLTGLMNRQGFDEQLELELERSRRTSQPVALVLADIDGFKELNDRFGHPAGDAALSAVGRVAGAVVRKTDTMARIGGDEFAAILPSATTEGAFELAERLRGEVARVHSEDGESLTMSFGVVEYPLHGTTAKDLVQAADRALYRAKGLGRNRSVVHSEELPQGVLGSAAVR